METLQGVHHFYLGIVMTLIGFFMLWAPRSWAAVLGIMICLLGIWIMADDFWQHAMERFVKPGYESPLKLAYGACVRQCPWIEHITHCADVIFRKK